jgi:hypothetical protein
MKKKYYVLGGILLLVLVGIGAGLNMYFKQQKDYAHSEADFTVSAAALCNEFCTNEAGANKKYVAENKTILVTGVVKEISKNQDGSATVILHTSDPECTVSCALTKEESSKTAKVQSGSTVKIKGQCTGMQELLDKQVIMIRCGLAGN